MIGRALGICAWLAGVGVGTLTMAEQHEPVADPAAMVIAGNARFTVLTPALIRMEWSPNSEFEDRASFVFINRRLPVPEYTTSQDDDRLIIETETLVLQYDESGRGFGEQNLQQIVFRDSGETGLEGAGALCKSQQVWGLC